MSPILFATIYYLRTKLWHKRDAASRSAIDSGYWLVSWGDIVGRYREQTIDVFSEDVIMDGVWRDVFKTYELVYGCSVFVLIFGALSGALQTPAGNLAMRTGRWLIEDGGRQRGLQKTFYVFFDLILKEHVGFSSSGGV